MREYIFPNSLRPKSLAACAESLKVKDYVYQYKPFKMGFLVAKPTVVA